MSKIKILLLSQLFFLFALPVLAQVDTAWVRRYNGPGGLGDVANAVVIDKSGNVYVTGYSVGSGTGPDFATIKYAANGDTLWIRRYNGPGNSYDVANAVTVDSNGNVYVTGESIGGGADYDYTTIKYTSNGDTLWVRRYNSSGNTDDYAKALAVDDSGNVYVAGFPVTIKYLPNGDAAWIRSSYGSGNALARDDIGNVYVCGQDVNLNLATVKFGPHGNTEWVRWCCGPGRANALAVDDSGYVYVTGSGSGTYDDYATIKFTSTGDTVWVRHYNGPADSIDVAKDLAVDDSGNVCVTGWSYGSSNYPDYATIKYNSMGDSVWVRRYSGVGYDNLTEGLAVDRKGNVYVTGRSIGLGTSNDYATIMYAPNGDTVWVRRYDGAANNNKSDAANALTVDDSGYVYVTGESFGSGTYPDYATIKYFPCLLKPGDVNASGGNPNLSDIIYLVNFLFKGGPVPPATCGGDPNGSGGSGDLTDVVYLVNFIFNAGPAPVEISVCCL